MLVIQISLVVIALCTLFLTTGTMAVIYGAWRAVRSLGKLLKEFKEEFQPLALRIEETVEHARQVAEGALDQAEGFADSVAGVRERAERMGAIFEVLEEDLERATLRLFGLMSGVGRFLRTTLRGDRRK